MQLNPSTQHVARTAVSPRAEQLDALFLLNSLALGGSETKTVRMANALWGCNVRMGVAYLNGPHHLLEDVAVRSAVWHLERSGKISLAAVRNLRTLIRERRPGVVLSVNLYPALYLAMATAGMTARPRRIAFLNTSVVPQQDLWQLPIYRPVLKRMDGLVFGCEAQRRQWADELGIVHPQTRVIYNGVDTDRFTPPRPAERAEARRRWGLQDSQFVVGTVGRLAREKNHAVLLRALAALRAQGMDAKVLLVGEGTLRTELEQLARTLHIDGHVMFAGAQKDVRGALAAIDVFVLPSIAVETFSNAALEAMACARPVILSDIGGASEMVAHGVEGFVVPIDRLGGELLTLLTRLKADPTLRTQMGEAARSRALQRFSSLAMLDAYLELLGRSHVATQRLSGG